MTNLNEHEKALVKANHAIEAIKSLRARNEDLSLAEAADVVRTFGATLPNPPPWPFKEGQRWTVRRYSGADGGRTFDEMLLKRFYDSIGTEKIDYLALHESCTGHSDRLTDRALQILRKAGLIRYVGGRWEKVS